MVHKIVAFALSLALLPAAQQASAQSTSFRGLRAEAQAGLDRFYSEGEHDHSFGYGAMVGFDGTIGDRFVMGAEGTYWQADGRNVTPGVVRRSLEEWGVAVRAGVLVTPTTLVYGRAGYAVDKQRKLVGGVVDRYRSTGYQVGGGIEQSLNDNFYVKGEARYSNYHSHSSRLVGLVGVGVRFR